MPLDTRDEFDALLESILRCAFLAPVGTCEVIGPDLRRCGQPERSAGTGMCAWCFALVKAAESAPVAGGTSHG